MKFRTARFNFSNYGYNSISSAEGKNFYLVTIMKRNFERFRSVDETVVAWRNFDKCSSKVPIVEWDSINWKDRNQTVIQMRRKIYLKTVEINNASCLTKVEYLNLQIQLQSLQRKLVFCHSNLLVSARQITQSDYRDIGLGQDFHSFLAVTDLSEISRLVTFIKDYINLSEWQPSPMLFVDSTQKSTIFRIPIIIDHIIQAIIKNALEPAHEVDTCTSWCFNNSYEAIDRVIGSCTLVSQPWIVNIDTRPTFDIVSFDHIKSIINTFPLYDLISRWLNCYPVSSKNTTNLLSQGFIFPLFLKLILNNIEHALSSSVTSFHPHYFLSETNQLDSSITFIRYLDNMLFICETEYIARGCRQLFIETLDSRGLRLLKSNIQISCLSSGFNYLGVNIRTYSTFTYGAELVRDSYINGGGFTYLLLVKPSKLSVIKVKRKIRSLFRQFRSYHLSVLVKKVNPLVKDWGLYYGRFCSQKTFSNLDFYLYMLQYRYGVWNHPGKGRAWIVNKYFGRFNLDREDKWVFGFYYLGKLYYMEKFSWIPRIR